MTYPLPRIIWRWLSVSPCGICWFPPELPGNWHWQTLQGATFFPFIYWRLIWIYVIIIHPVQMICIWYMLWIYHLSYIYTVYYIIIYNTCLFFWTSKCCLTSWLGTSQPCTTSSAPDNSLSPLPVGLVSWSYGRWNSGVPMFLKFG